MSKARSRARRLAMQGIYEWQMSDNSATDIHDHNVATDKVKKIDAVYYEALLRGVLKYLAEVDAAFEPFLKRPIAEVDPIELSILRLAVYELIYRMDVPYRVVINEAIDLAKNFGGESGHKFINGILDKTAAKLRELEQRK